MERRPNEEELLAEYLQAKDDLRSSSEERIAQARERFLRLGDYKNSATLAQRCEMLMSFRLGNSVSFFKNAVGKGRLAMIYMSYNAKIADIIICQNTVLQKIFSPLNYTTKNGICKEVFQLLSLSAQFFLLLRLKRLLLSFLKSILSHINLFFFFISCLRKKRSKEHTRLSLSKKSF